MAAGLALSEVLRLLHGGEVHGLIDLDLLSPDQRSVWAHPGNFSRFNPGVFNGWVIAVRVDLVVSVLLVRDQVAPALAEMSQATEASGEKFEWRRRL